jgi:hypothetical protein
MQCVTFAVWRRSTLKPVGFAGHEAMVKDYGVAMAMLPGQELGASLVQRS